MRLMSVVEPIRVQGVHLTYPTPDGGVNALVGADLVVAAGEVVCLYGASGSGKSTLLMAIAGLEIPDQGSISVAGREVVGMSESKRTELRLRTVGLVFQEHNLVAQFTARENVEIVLRCQGCHAPRQAALELLDALGVANLAERLPSAMSGGQRQRVGIARALAGDRPFLLCDEPTGALDSSNSIALFERLAHLAAEKNVGCLIASHDPLAERFADRVLAMRDGVVHESGSAA